MELGEVLEQLVDWLKKSVPTANIMVGYPVLDATKKKPVAEGKPLVRLRELSRSASPGWFLAADPVLVQTIDSTTKTGTGSATAVSSGMPTASKTITLQVTLAGDIGVAEGKVTDDGGITWTTPAVLTTAFDLGHGVKLTFTGGAGNDFGVGDEWTVETTATSTATYVTHAVRAPLQLDVLTHNTIEFYGKPASTPPVQGLDATLTLWIQNLVGGPDEAGLVVGDGEGVSFEYGGGTVVPPGDEFSYFHFAYTLYVTGELTLSATQELVDGFNFQITT